MWIYSSCLSRTLILFPISPLLCETVGNLLKHCPSNYNLPSWEKMQWNFWHWSVCPILTTHKQVSAVLAVDAGRFFLPSQWSLFFGRKYREKIIEHLLQTIPFSPLPHLLHRKDSPAPAALAAGAGHSFLPFLIQPYSLFPIIMVGTKMPSLETFRSNMTKTPTKCYVDYNAVSWLSICSLLHISDSVFDIKIVDRCSAMFIGDKANFIHC